MCFLCKTTFNSVEIPILMIRDISRNRRKSKHPTLLTSRSSYTPCHPWWQEWAARGTFSWAPVSPFLRYGYFNCLKTWQHLDPVLVRRLSSINQGSRSRSTGWGLENLVNCRTSSHSLRQASVFPHLHYGNILTPLAIRTSLSVQNLKWDSLQWMRGETLQCSPRETPFKHIWAFAFPCNNPAL